MEITHVDILVVAAIAAAAPILSDLTRGVRVPIVVAEIGLGILIGPELLGLAEVDSFIDALSTFGLAFLFFLAGMEIDFKRIAGAPSRLAGIGWLLSLAFGLAIAIALWLAGAIDAPVLAGLALTTTALGTLMPILRDSGIVDERFGNYVVGAGAAGEFGPVVIVSIILAIEAGETWRTALLFVFAAVAVGATVIALRVRPARVVRLIETTMGTSGQLAVRLSLLLIVALAVIASDFGLDVILGAFAAGIIVGLVIRERDAHEFEAKLDAVGFGFLIPVFFIATGMEYDIDALVSSPSALVLLPGFALLFLVVRGLPVWLLYRGELEPAERVPMMLFSASALPLVVAITEIGTETGVMREQEASALVGAAMLSILVFPLLALALRRRAARAAPA